MAEELLALLESRGLIDNITSSEQELKELLSRPIRFYCGFDPTADSLHLGNLLPMVLIEWFRRYGHQPVVLVGGATGMIGDPSGKATERQLLSEELLSSNVEAIARQLRHLFSASEGQTALFVNNLDWYRSFSLISFLRDVGKLFRLGPMLGKEMVRTRLQSEEGMSFTEFSYQLLQAYDFLHLFDEHQVVLQLGGSDQWGNITAGIELIRKLRNGSSHGLTMPLLTRSDGQKLGKSERGAIWLSKEKLSPYLFYQELYRIDDKEVVDLLRKLTFLPLEEIESWRRQLEEGTALPHGAQKVLAQEVTRFVHGPEGLSEAEAITANLAPGKETQLDEETLRQLADQHGKVQLSRELLVGQKLIDTSVQAGLFASKAEARRMVRNGGLYLNNQPICDEQYTVEIGDLLTGRYLLLSKGKKSKLLIELTD